MSYGYGYIEDIILMRPDDYEVWLMSENNLYITPKAYADLLEHYGIEINELYSLYTMKNILSSDRDYAELHGIDMSSDETIIIGLAKLDIISVNGLRYMEKGYNSDRAMTPSGKTVIVLSLFEED